MIRSIREGDAQRRSYREGGRNEILHQKGVIRRGGWEGSLQNRFPPHREEKHDKTGRETEERRFTYLSN